MKEIFDWLREEIRSYSCDVDTFSGKVVKSLDTEDALEAIAEAEAKWKEKEAELRANVIDKFAEKLKSDYHKHEIINMLKHGEDYSRYGREKSLDEYIDEIASQMKGEKEC